MKTKLARKMRFMGQQGSMGFEKNKMYDIFLDTSFMHAVVVRTTDRKLFCPYSSIGSFLDNWQDEVRILPMPKPTVIVHQGKGQIPPEVMEMMVATGMVPEGFMIPEMAGGIPADEPEVEEVGQKGRISPKIISAVTMIVDKFRASKAILPHVSLEEKEVEQIVDSLRDVIHMYEGTYHKYKKR